MHDMGSMWERVKSDFSNDLMMYQKEGQAIGAVALPNLRDTGGLELLLKTLTQVIVRCLSSLDLR